jgi:hypothetical protein
VSTRAFCRLRDVCGWPGLYATAFPARIARKRLGQGAHDQGDAADVTQIRMGQQPERIGRCGCKAEAALQSRARQIVR